VVLEASYERLQAAGALEVVDVTDRSTPCVSIRQPDYLTAFITNYWDDEIHYAQFTPPARRHKTVLSVSYRAV